jgi:hypothetical protein
MMLNVTPSPTDKIVLLDGRELIAYPRAWKEPSMPDRRVPTIEEFLDEFPLDDELAADAAAKEAAMAQRGLFIENAFFLYEHREQILSDSRMFLSPVTVESGLAYTGKSGFRNPTLGVYIEWWMNCKGALRRGDDGVRSLVYYLAGSPLSGMNGCSAIREDGVSERVELNPFSEYWRSFMHINKRYDDAKSCYEAYTLQQVVDLLKKA